MTGVTLAYLNKSALVTVTQASEMARWQLGYTEKIRAAMPMFYTFKGSWITTVSVTYNLRLQIYKFPCCNKLEQFTTSPYSIFTMALMMTLMVIT